MTQNLAPFFIGGDPLNLYKRNMIPFEVMTPAVGSHSQTLSTASHSSGIDHLIKGIIQHRHKKGKSSLSHGDIKEHLLSHTRTKGMTDAQGEGFWSHVGDSLMKGAQNIVENPVSTLNSVSHLASLLLI